MQGGGDLVSFTTEEEQNEALSVVGEAKGSWIGFNDFEKENNFQWSDGSKKVWKNWKKNEPSGWTRENCACISAKSYPQWADLSCTTKRSFICEYDAGYIP